MNTKPDVLNSTKWRDTIACLNELLATQEDVINISVDYTYGASFLRKPTKPGTVYTRVLLMFEAFEKRFLNSDVLITIDFAGVDFVRLNAFPDEDLQIVYSGCCSKKHLLETWHDWLCASDDPEAQELLRSDLAANAPDQGTWAPGGCEVEE